MHYYINHCFPVREKNIYNNDKPWVTTEIHQSARRKRKLFAKNNIEWKNEEKRLRKLIRSAKQQFRNSMSDKLGKIGDRGWYNCVKKVLNGSPKSVLSSVKLIEGFGDMSDIEIINAINHHFSSITSTKTPLVRASLPSFLPPTHDPVRASMEEVCIQLNKLKINKSTSPQSIPSVILRECSVELCYVISHILNSSYETGCVPDSWRQGFIAVLPKVASIKSLGDLRPIAVTSNIAKLAEFFVHKQLIAALVPHISALQYGVIPKRSTNHYLVKMMNFVLSSLDKKSSPVALTLLDCQKAFDMVDHTIIINRLISMGINGYIVNWCINFLNNRSNCVRVGKLLSRFLPMTRGLIQGSLNGPLTFILVFDPFLQQIQALNNSNLEVYGFVDDATAAAVESCSANLITSLVMQEAPIAAENIKMKLNAKKTQLIIIDFTKSKQSQNWQFTLDNSPVEIVSSARLLGVIINDQLTWNDHVDSIVTKASCRLWMLRSLKNLGFSAHELTTLFKSSVIPILEYASPVWGSGLTATQTESLERVQWRAVQIICSKRVKFNSPEYIETLILLNLTNLATRRKELALSFALSLLSSPAFRHWLPPFITGKRNLRKQNLLVPFRCRTSRYGKSPIPYFVDIINEKFQLSPESLSHFIS